MERHLAGAGGFGGDEVGRINEITNCGLGLLPGAGHGGGIGQSGGIGIFLVFLLIIETIPTVVGMVYYELVVTAVHIGELEGRAGDMPPADQAGDAIVKALAVGGEIVGRDGRALQAAEAKLIFSVSLILSQKLLNGRYGHRLLAFGRDGDGGARRDDIALRLYRGVAACRQAADGA